MGSCSGFAFGLALPDWLDLSCKRSYLGSLRLLVGHWSSVFCLSLVSLLDCVDHRSNGCSGTSVLSSIPASINLHYNVVILGRLASYLPFGGALTRPPPDGLPVVLGHPALPLLPPLPLLLLMVLSFLFFG